ncbi:MAG: hypothetical protein QM804_14505 [Propionicimonas sp.]
MSATRSALDALARVLGEAAGADLDVVAPGTAAPNLGRRPGSPRSRSPGWAAPEVVAPSSIWR